VLTASDMVGRCYTPIMLRFEKGYANDLSVGTIHMQLNTDVDSAYCVGTDEGKFNRKLSLGGKFKQNHVRWLICVTCMDFRTSSVV
jgi:hypothetical protein